MFTDGWGNQRPPTQAGTAGRICRVPTNMPACPLEKKPKSSDTAMSLLLSGRYPGREEQPPQKGKIFRDATAPHTPGTQNCTKGHTTTNKSGKGKKGKQQHHGNPPLEPTQF
jgi:hypothetical protein